MIRDRTLGATRLVDGRCRFRVWAPQVEQVELVLHPPGERVVPMAPAGGGYHEATVEGVRPGARYRYRLDGGAPRPDPASRFQPEGVHGPSAVPDPDYRWSDDRWTGLLLRDYVLYELHVGTFTSEGTFAAVIPRLADLRDLGVTAVELMPVAQFPGRRNWGYDGVQPFAVQDSYGGPDGLKRLVDACHREGMAVVLDVVYNHLGPEGNFLGEFGPYFTDRYRTPWGPAINFDGPESDEVRRYFIENALQWFEDFHVDALRLDAVHAIVDPSARPFLQELADSVRRSAERSGRRVHLIGESDRNDARLIRPPALGGLGLDAQWNDDFHHALHALLTGEASGYYQDFGELRHLARSLRQGYCYSGQHSPFRRRRHGNPPAGCPPHRFVVSIQNHDQIGNRAHGDRLAELVAFEALKLAAGTVCLSPMIPLLFMGEEYGETAPFLYFTHHGDPGLIEAVRKGRREEFAAFAWKGEVPDPQAEATFARSRPDPARRAMPENTALRALYKECLRLRRDQPALADPEWEMQEVAAFDGEKILVVRRWNWDEEAALVFHYDAAPVNAALPFPAGRWRKLLDSADARWLGPGSGAPAEVKSDGSAVLPLAPHAFLLYVRDRKPPPAKKAGAASAFAATTASADQAAAAEAETAVAGEAGT